MKKLVVNYSACELFTPAEIDELRRIVEGLNVKSSALGSGRSAKTIETHRWRIASKLQTRGTTGILIEGLRLGIIVVTDAEGSPDGDQKTEA